jgi:flagellar biosynthetic protein FliR
MNELLQAAVASQAALSQFILVFLRVGGTMLVLPAFGEASVPRRIRLGLAIGFAMVVAPAVGSGRGQAVFQPALPSSSGAFAMLVLSETVIGLVLGFAIRLSVMALSMAGTMIGQATSLAQAFGASDAEPVPAAAHLLVVGGLALATVMGLHVDMARAMVLSYEAFPMGAVLPADRTFDWALGHAGAAISLALSLAMPFFAASVAYNIALGVMNRAMPQLMLSLVGAPALSLGVLALMVVAIPAGLAHWADDAAALLSDPLAPAGTAP